MGLSLKVVVTVADSYLLTCFQRQTQRQIKRQRQRKGVFMYLRICTSPIANIVRRIAMYDCDGDDGQVGMTDSDYLSAFHQVVLPLAAEFEPQLVLVSAGFDPALGCPEGEQRVIFPLGTNHQNILNSEEGTGSQ